MRKKTNNPPPQPFRLRCKPDACEPKKKDHLQAAAAHLGPFRYKTNVEARAAGAAFSDGRSTFASSQETAERLVTTIAATFNKALYLEERAPRLKDVFSELESLKNAIDAYYNTLSRLNDVTLHELRSRDECVTKQQAQVLSNMDLARVQELPRPANDPSADTDPGWIDCLAALRKHVEFTKQRIQSERRQRGRPATDVGGKTNLYKDVMGNPKWGLAYDCFTLCDAFKPDQASGYEEGPFHKFVMDVFEYATGVEGSMAGMQDWVKQVVPARREFKALHHEITQVSEVLECGERAGEFDSEAGMRRWKELMRWYDALSKREAALEKRLRPHG